MTFPQAFNYFGEEDETAADGPPYCIVQYSNYSTNFFPVKRNTDGEYDLMIRKNYYLGSDEFEYCWEYQKHPESTSLKYEKLHGFDTYDQAAQIIEDIDDVSLVNVSWDGRPFEKGPCHFFDTKQKYEDRNQEAIDSAETIDEMIERKFTKEEIKNTKVGAERDLFDT